ncbi:hypothetical protein F4809DRAFT_292857 [Biscogniauxia mediterranea]|nr:hypothetical protein F4809DRAFT_292857 [Biscogniauxia mediterranea]
MVHFYWLFPSSPLTLSTSPVPSQPANQPTSPAGPQKVLAHPCLESFFSRLFLSAASSWEILHRIHSFKSRHLCYV